MRTEAVRHGSREWTMLAAAALWCGALAAQQDDAAGHARLARAHGERMEIAAAAREWERVVELEPGNAEARAALTRLAAFDRTDGLLDVAGSLLDGGFPSEAGNALDRWTPTWTTPDLQARYLVLRGRVQLAVGRVSEALVTFASAEAAAESPAARLPARLGRVRTLLARVESRLAGEGLLAELAREAAGTDLEAEVAWVGLASRPAGHPGRVDALRDFLSRFPNSPHQVEARLALAAGIEQMRGGPDRDSVEPLLASLAEGALADRSACGDRVRQAIAKLTDPAVILWLAEALAALPAAEDSPVPPPELAALAYRRCAALARGPVALDAARALQRAIAKLVLRPSTDPRQVRWRKLEAESYLVEGQLLLLDGDPGTALRILEHAAELHSALARAEDTEAGATLLRLGRILESRARPEAAARLYDLVARTFVANPLGPDALWALSQVLRRRLDRPLEALAVLARHHDLYPPDFRIPTAAEERIRRLGYAGVSAFQTAHGLKVDGGIGPETQGALRTEEENFREVLPDQARAAIKGRYVHDEIFAIARDLEDRGRFREAVLAYHAFLSLYPGHNRSDDALRSIAGIFQRHGLEREALAAYERMMEDYPKGDLTGPAHLDAAQCALSLGDWSKAAELYDLYQKKFPRQRQAAEARAHLEAVRKLIRYAGLVQDGPPPAKLAAALYEMGRILTKELDNRKKAAALFAESADRCPTGYQAPEARFSQGVCLLREEDFAGARDAFAGLLRERPDSRLADDAQYWIAHTYEYQARATGRLDFKRVILKKRSADEAEQLARDLDLRRQYDPNAQAPPAPAAPRPGWREGETGEQVREDLHRALTAYRKTVDDYPLGDMGQKALLRIGAICSDYLKDAEGAIAAYRLLLERFPGSPEAVDAQFAVGRHYLDGGDLVQAEKAIKQFLTAYPNHDRAGEALLDLAQCHGSQREWQKALDDYESFLSRYPQSEQAGRVREQIEWLKKYRFE